MNNLKLFFRITVIKEIEHIFIKALVEIRKTNMIF